MISLRKFFMLLILSMSFLLMACSGAQEGGGGEVNPPSQPALQASNQVNTILTPILNWQSQGATRYDLFFGENPTPPLLAANLTNSSYAFINNPLEPGTLYYWRVVAKNAAGTSSSPIGKLTTQYVAPVGSSIELVDIHVSPNQAFTLVVKGYGITQMRGLDLHFLFDPNALELVNVNGHPVEQAGALSDAFIIYDDHEQGILQVSITSPVSVNIHNQEALRVFFRSKNQTGVKQISLSNHSVLMNAVFQTIPFVKDAGTILIEP